MRLRLRLRLTWSFELEFLMILSPRLREIDVRMTIWWDIIARSIQLRLLRLRVLQQP